MKLSKQAATIATTFTLAGILLSAPTPARAQVQPQQPPDSVVAAVADAMSLPFVPADQRPVFGTFWEVHSTLPCLGAPLPCPPFDTNAPVYSIGDPTVGGQFLVDLTAGRVISSQAQYNRRALRSMTTASVVQAQAEELQTFVAQVQARQAYAELHANDQMGRLSLDGGGVYGPMGFSYTADDLWLEIVTVTNSTGWFVVHPPETEATTGVYDLLMTTNLSAGGPGLNLTNWLWLLRTDPGETNLIVPDLWPDQAYFMLGRTNDTDGDGMSDAYEHLVSHTSPTSADAPTITFQPLTQEICSRDTVTFTVTAEGPQPLTYQWLLNGTPITNATSASLTLLNVQQWQGGDYSVLVSGPTGLSVLSSNATLTVDLCYGGGFVTALFGPRQDYTFRSGMTYYIESFTQLYGVTTVQGGTVIKLWGGTNSSLAIMGKLVCQTEEPFSPVFLTSAEDDAVGAHIWFSSGQPQTATNGCPLLDLSCAQVIPPALSNLRFRYADQAIGAPPGPKHLSLWDCQFLQCNGAVAANADTAVAFHNVLMSGCGAAVAAATNVARIDAEHLTADVSTFWSGPCPPVRVSLTNSIVVGDLNSPVVLVTDHLTLNPTGSVFQPVGAGNYYLAPNTACAFAGTTNISPRLLAELRRKTTQPPIAFPPLMQLQGELALGPQARRYAGGPPDLGYYYDPLDYTVAWLASWGQITILPGTIIGFRDEYSPALDDWTRWGFDLREGSIFVSQGTPTNPITFTDAQLVQEQFEYACLASFVPDFWPTDAGAPPPSLDFRFCNFYASPTRYHLWSGYDEGLYYLLAPDSLMNWTMRDCNLHSGRINLGPPDDGNYGAPMDFFYGSGAVSWANNLFDNVSVTLDPTYYWYLGVMNCDLSFQACNNLFRGGAWFALEPIPATAGNWTFHDNLFDKVELRQDTNQPLVFDHNGYWPLESHELRWNDGAPQLLPTSAGTPSHEVVLSCPPPYQTGPFGDYYLPISTPLYHGGSRTGSDAGLFHYTTRLDQVKDGSSDMISIGLHYIATAAPGSTQPKDSDGDGVPDYVENWHGDGDYASHVDSETDWTNAFTVTGIYDPTNSVCDDRDLCGNGLPGQVKRSLNIGPFDTANPLALLGIDPTLPVLGERTIPLALADPTNASGPLVLFVDGQQAETGDVLQETNGTWSTFWDTTTLNNGPHTLQVGCNYISASGVQRAAYGPLVLVEVNNPITFDPINDAFTDVLFVRGTLQSPVSAYTINIYSAGPDHTLLYTTNGVPSGDTIDETWDVTAAGTNADNGLQAEFAFPQDPQVPQPVVKHYSLERLLPGNSFTLGWGWDQGTPTQLNDRGFYVLIGLVNMLGTDLNGMDFDLLPSGPGGNVPYGCSFQLDGSQAAHDRLLNSIADPNSLNFFFWGHGYADAFGWTKFDRYPPSTLRANEIADLLGNPAGTNGPLHACSHPYRFVFLDACGTYSAKMARAFGIAPFARNGTTRTVADYLQWHREPRAFIGWDVTVMGSDIHGDLCDLYRVTAQQIVLGYWQAGFSVQDAMMAWDAYLPDKQCLSSGALYRDVDPNADDPANPGHKLGIYPPMKTWKISGCWDLTRYSPF